MNYICKNLIASEEPIMNSEKNEPALVKEGSRSSCL